jgi:hypothetical protein
MSGLANVNVAPCETAARGGGAWRERRPFSASLPPHQYTAVGWMPPLGQIGGHT